MYAGITQVICQPKKAHSITRVTTVVILLKRYDWLTHKDLLVGTRLLVGKHL